LTGLLRERAMRVLPDGGPADLRAAVFDAFAAAFPDDPRLVEAMRAHAERIPDAEIQDALAEKILDMTASRPRRRRSPWASFRGS